MTEKDFLERLRADAQQLRYEPEDAVLWSRLSARIRDGVAASPDVPQLLTRWFRPITASFLMIALAAALSVAWFERARDTSSTIDAMAPNSVEISVDGDTFSFTE